MDNKGILIIVFTIIIVLGIFIAAMFLVNGNFISDNNSVNDNDTVGNNSLNISSNNSSDIKNATISSSSSSSKKTYDDWQQDYETGMYDEDGNPIYRSVFSTSGGQYNPGIYEAYWSANGPINETRIG